MLLISLTFSCASDHSPAVAIKQHVSPFCGFVTVNLDVDVDLLMAFLLHLKTILRHFVNNNKYKISQPHFDIDNMSFAYFVMCYTHIRSRTSSRFLSHCHIIFPCHTLGSLLTSGWGFWNNW